jgi:membrane-associated protease RseP (regulator of RpoE activity)
MTYVIGVVLFALGIVISLVLHEAGHFGTVRGDRGLGGVRQPA